MDAGAVALRARLGVPQDGSAAAPDAVLAPGTIFSWVRRAKQPYRGDAKRHCHVERARIAADEKPAAAKQRGRFAQPSAASDGDSARDRVGDRPRPVLVT